MQHQDLCDDAYINNHFGNKNILLGKMILLLTIVLYTVIIFLFQSTDSIFTIIAVQEQIGSYFLYKILSTKKMCEAELRKFFFLGIKLARVMKQKSTLFFSMFSQLPH